MSGTYQRYTWMSFVRETALASGAALWIVPFVLLVLVSLEPTSQLLENPTGLPESWDFGNYGTAWSEAGIGRAAVNSVIITAGSVGALVVLGSASAYAIARARGRMGGVVYLMAVIGLILPTQLGVIPLYTALRSMGLVGSYAGMIVLYTGLWLPLAIFLYTNFARNLPRDYEEAAAVDGASPLRMFRSVVFPLLRPATGTVAVLTGVQIWNDFFFPIIFLNGTDRTPLPLTVYTYIGGVATKWNLVFAAVAMTILPVLVLFFAAQRQLMRGFSGGVKS
ncbi:carbohydrate ABC transporter membrane protein 2 (CUT1 family) [Actinocorallia herbida]|uniref:Carbohydrate ABC transporter membrane protein 2 (CUT1 family) n=1 Tax=Actinocorallia herbida TaxID=58109 RepID=A0A3N1D3E9_9ACTN|nr:carbohydrate ABC transporter permease [Actinocorallia herbida]ROO88063.1 carbohydrate ABC transporter membrane protein 2 (CUT1 family) [Actinocorallia herbida]